MQHIISGIKHGAENVGEVVHKILFVPLWDNHETRALKQVQQESKRLLGNKEFTKEMAQIDLDLEIMHAADERDENDRTLQTQLFGKPVFKRETHTFRITKENLPEEKRKLLPILEAFNALESSKAIIRYELRPPLERMIEQVRDIAKNNHEDAHKKLKEAFHSLQRHRLRLMTEREHMMKQRAVAYQMVDDYLHGRSITVQNADILKEAHQEDLSLVENVLQETSNLKSFTQADRPIYSEESIEKEIEEKRRQLQEAEKAVASTHAEAEAKRRVRNAAVRHRTMRDAGVLIGLASVAAGSIIHHKRQERDRPYSQISTPISSRLETNNTQTSDLYRHQYARNPFDKRTVEVRAHDIEKDSDTLALWHGKLAAEIEATSYRIGSGDANAPTDYSPSMMYPKRVTDLAVPEPISQFRIGNKVITLPDKVPLPDGPIQQGVQFLSVDDRPTSIENLLTSTSKFHVVNNSSAFGYTLPPGSSWLRNERAFELGITCPITIPSGDFEIETIIPANCQDPGETGHYPRYALQVGEANFVKFKNDNNGYKSLAEANHPGPFVVHPIPDNLSMSYPEYAQIASSQGLPLDGTSFAAPGLAGTLAAIKHHYPQLSWDNIVYAVALSCKKDFIETFENRIEKFCHKMASLNMGNNPELLPQALSRRKQAYEHTKEVLGDTLDSSVTEENFYDAKPFLIKAIREKYSNVSDPVRAFATDFNRLNYSHFTVDTPTVMFQPNNDNDLSYDPQTGFGTPNPELLELILQNMVAAKVLHPEYQDRPEAIVQDSRESRLSKRTTITIPKNRDIFKIALDIVPTKNNHLDQVTLTDDHGRATNIYIVPGQPITRYSDWSHLTQHGGTFSITADAPFQIGYVAHTNAPNAISLGITRIQDLQPLSELRKRITPEQVAQLPIMMPTAPRVIRARDLAQQMASWSR